LQENSDQNRKRAEAAFKKEERARDGAKAMMEYEAETRAVREKTARLGRFDWRCKRRMSDGSRTPAWRDAVTGVAFGVLVFVALIAVLVVGVVILDYGF